MDRSCIACLLAGGIGLVGVTQALGQQSCKPTLIFKEVQFSGMQPPTGERRWTAVVSVDASRCTTTAGFLRDRVLAAKGKRRRDRVPRALSMVAARGESRAGFLGRRSRGALLDRQRSNVPLRQMTEVRPHTINSQAVRTCIHSIACRPRAGASTDRTIAKFLLAAPRSGKRPDVVDGADYGVPDAGFGHEKF